MAIKDVAKTGALAVGAGSQSFQDTAAAYRLVRETKNMAVFGEAVQTFEKSTASDGALVKNLNSGFKDSLEKVIEPNKVLKTENLKVNLLEEIEKNTFNLWKLFMDNLKGPKLLGGPSGGIAGVAQKRADLQREGMLVQTLKNINNNLQQQAAPAQKKGKFPWMSLLKGGLLGAAAWSLAAAWPAIEKFFNSETWKDIMKWVEETWDTTKKKVKAVTTTLGTSWDNAKKDFKEFATEWEKNAAQYKKDGKFWTLMKNQIAATGKLALKGADNFAATLWNLIAHDIFGIEGAEKTTSVYGSIKAWWHRRQVRIDKEDAESGARFDKFWSDFYNFSVTGWWADLKGDIKKSNERIKKRNQAENERVRLLWEKRGKDFSKWWDETSSKLVANFKGMWGKVTSAAWWKEKWKDTKHFFSEEGFAEREVLRKERQERFRKENEAKRKKNIESLNKIWKSTKGFMGWIKPWEQAGKEGLLDLDIVGKTNEELAAATKFTVFEIAELRRFRHLALLKYLDRVDKGGHRAASQFMTDAEWRVIRGGGRGRDDAGQFPEYGIGNEIMKNALAKTFAAMNVKDTDPSVFHFNNQQSSGDKIYMSNQETRAPIVLFEY